MTGWGTRRQSVRHWRTDLRRLTKPIEIRTLRREIDMRVKRAAYRHKDRSARSVLNRGTFWRSGQNTRQPTPRETRFWS
jgi:hypothetical protein